MYLRIPSQTHNLRVLRASPLAEISGSLGDLGTLLPLLLALTLTKSISLSTTLVFTGLANVFTGLFFSIPLPVQPMKAVAAVAIANKFSQAETASAGLFVALIIGVCSAAGLLSWVGRVVPIPVIKGIQVGAGLSLVLSAGTAFFAKLTWNAPHVLDNHWWTVLAFLGLLVTNATTTTRGSSRIPFALAIFIVGIVFAGITKLSDHQENPPAFGIWHPHAVKFTWPDVRHGAVDAGLGQLPLTALNSIIAVTHLASELIPNVATPSEASIGLSVAFMNAISCPFGAMPTCHGSGGLAAQYKFGARSGSSVIMLGLFKLALGLVLDDDWLVALLQQFPHSFLGIMVCAAGVELASVGASLNSGAKDLWERADDEMDGKRLREPDEAERKERWMVMTVTAAGLLAFRNDAVGFLAGLACHVSLRAPIWYGEWRGGQVRLPGQGHDYSAEEGESLLER